MESITKKWHVSQQQKITQKQIMNSFRMTPVLPEDQESQPTEED